MSKVEVGLTFLNIILKKSSEAFSTSTSWMLVTTHMNCFKGMHLSSSNGGSSLKWK